MPLPSWFSPREWFARPNVNVVARMVPSWQKGRPLPQHFDIKAFADEGYRKNIIVAACLWEIMGSASEPTIQAVQTKADGAVEQLPPTHALSQLLARPNPEMSTTELLERILLHEHIGGKWLLHKIRSGREMPAELWPLRPDRTAPVQNNEGLIERYVFTDDAGKKHTIKGADVVEGILRPDYLDDFNGLSPIAPAARWIDLDNQAAEYLRTFFYNGAQPGGLLKFKRTTQPQERERVREMWRERYGQSVKTGVKWHDTAVVDSDVDYKEIGSRPSKLGMQPTFDETETRICAAFNMPPIVIAVRVGLQFSTYANYKEARTSLWDETLKPLYRKIGNKLTVGVAHEFGPDLAVRINFDEVQALQEASDSRRAFAIDGFTSGLLTKDEAREVIGKAPVKGGDQFASTGGAPSLGDLFGRTRRLEQHKATRSQRTAIRNLMAQHFQEQGEALVDHLRAELEQSEE